MEGDTYKGYPLVNATMDDLEFSDGYNTVGLVLEPATEKPVFMFSKDEPVFIDGDKIRAQFNVKDQERRLIMGVMMLADTPIERRMHIEEDGKTVTRKFYMQFPKDVVERMAHKAMIDKRTSNANIEHDKERKVDGVHIVESYVYDKSRGLSIPEFMGEVPEGSWIVTLRLDNDEAWNMFKSGEVVGLSLEGNFGLEQNFSADTLELSDIRDKLYKGSVEESYNVLVQLAQNG